MLQLLSRQFFYFRNQRLNRKQKFMMKRFTGIFSIALIVLIAMTSVPAVAETEIGTGDGSGGGTDIAFALVESTPQNGATGVDVNDSIWLLFNKNVVNMTVRDINKANIVLRDSDGHKVSAEVTMKDDQVEPEYRREIVVDPSDSLDPGTTYKLTVGSAVQAKNGQTLNESYTITFTTAENTTSSQQSGTTDSSQGQSVDNTQDGSSQGQDSNVENPTSTEKESSRADALGGKAGWIAMLLAGVVLLGGSTFALVVMRKKSKNI
jgi:methionine-rich copper-binding protein CopC